MHILKSGLSGRDATSVSSRREPCTDYLESLLTYLRLRPARLVRHSRGVTMNIGPEDNLKLAELL